MVKAAARVRYEPGSAFEEVKEEAVLDISPTESTEFWLIQWPKDQLDVSDFHGKELFLKLHKDGNLGSLESSSGKSYQLVSFAAQQPDATVFQPSGSEIKPVGKISRRVCLVRYPEPEELAKPNFGSFTPSSKKTAGSSRKTMSRFTSASKNRSSQGSARSLGQWSAEPTPKHKHKRKDELATLCGIKACVVAYEEGETQPEVWPPSASEARHVLEKFKGMPDLGKFKKTQSHEDFLHRRVAKLRAEVRKLERENREIETRDLLHESMDGRRPGLDGTTIGELTSLHSLVKTKTARVKELLQQLVIGQGTLPIPNQPAQSSSSQPQAFYTYPRVQTMAELEEFLSQQQDWPTDLVPNGGELDSVVYSAGYVGTGNLGGDETQT